MSKTVGYIYSPSKSLMDHSDPSMIQACSKLSLTLSLDEICEEDGIFRRLYVVEGDPLRWVEYLDNVNNAGSPNGMELSFTMEVHDYEH